jgi:hypothetical protein
MVAIVASIPDTVASVGSDSVKMEGPEIEVVGKYLKRLAYQSRLGADLAPVIVGQITSAPISEREHRELTDSNVPDQADAIWLPILLACLLGVALAFLVMWRTSEAAKRARKLRRSHRRDPGFVIEDIARSVNQNSIHREDS